MDMSQLKASLKCAVLSHKHNGPGVTRSEEACSMLTAGMKSRALQRPDQPGLPRG